MGAYEGILWAGAQGGERGDRGIQDKVWAKVGEGQGDRGRLVRRSPVHVSQDVICLWVLDGHDDARRQD